MAKNVTTYSYIIATQTKNGLVDRPRLEQEINGSVQIETKLKETSTSDGYINITFYDTLGATEEAFLGNSIVAQHAGEQLPLETIQLTKLQEDEIPQFALAPRVGSEIVIGTHNFCDQVSWFGESIRAENQTMVAKDGYDGYVWKSTNSTHVNWIDLESGRVHNQEKWDTESSHGYTISVTVDSVEKTKCPPFTFTSDYGDYWVNHDDGEITFFEDMTGKTVKATFSYASGSTFYLKPTSGKILRIEDAETDFSKDCVLNTKFGYIVVGYVDVFAPQYMRGSNDLGYALSITTLDPPGSPSVGDTYIVGGTGTGAWTGYDGAVVQWDGYNWIPSAPSEEDWLTVVDAGMYFTFRNSTWNPTPYPSGTQIPLQEDYYHKVTQIITEARGALPPVGKIGASAEHLQISDIKEFRRKSRGMKNDVQAVPFNYATARELISSYGMELWVNTGDDICVEGEMLTITFYCSSIDEA